MTLVETPLPLLAFKDETITRGFGLLEVKPQNGPTQLPLQRVDISARVVDRFAVTTMTETFRNTFEEPLEATYVFPLPGGGVVTDLEMHVGGKVLRGAIEERAQAQRQYVQALDDGKRAALLEKERDGVFTVQVGNIAPDESVKIIITWSERLPYFDNGTVELRLPLVVAPRYIPGTPLDRPSVGVGTESDTDRVPDASRITPPRLAEGFDPKVGLHIEVDLNDGNLADLECSQHATRLGLDSGHARVTLAREGERLNRDFVLRWRVARAEVSASLWVSRAGENTHAALSIVPPRPEGFMGRPRDVVFVLDRSGSMEGSKMVSAARACAILLNTLGPRDRFAIELFDDRVDWLEPLTGDTVSTPSQPFAVADEAGIEVGERFLRGVEARGGTEIGSALDSAQHMLSKNEDEGMRAAIIILLTDGQIGDEGHVLEKVSQSSGDTRIFTVGIDTAVNEGFLNRLAALAGGTAAFVAPGAHLEGALQAVGREIGVPLVTDVTVEGPTIERDSVVPARMPDLFAGRAATAYLAMKKPGEVRVRGRYADGSALDITVPASTVDTPAIGQLWARGRISDLEDRYRLEPEKQAAIKKQIITLSKAHHVLTRFTAFVVVDEEVVNATGKRRRVTQAVEMPAEWEMDAYSATRSLTVGAVAQSLSTGGAAKRVRAAIPPSASPPMAPPPMAFSCAEAPDEFALASPARMMGSPADRSIEGVKEIRSSLPPPATVLDVIEAIDAVRDAIATLLTDLRAGRRPKATALKRAQRQLTQVLGRRHDASQFALLQRFRRTALPEMLAALDDASLPPASLVPLFERGTQTLDDATAEARGLMGSGHEPTPQTPYWESSI
ncbi:MAG: VWA domain-containing protein [Proteobacteria bacterium]|nr:VWA domain-containing protein [Pseudomonadota bacterium]